MPSTYLALTNKLLRRINEVELDSSNFASARGIHATAKDAIADTIDEIQQTEQVWPFNTAVGTQLLVVGQEEYTWPVNVQSGAALLLVPDWESFYIEKDTNLNVATTQLTLMNRNEWMMRHRAVDYNSDTDGYSVPFYVFPSDTGFGVTPSPNQAYTVKFQYYRLPTTLTAFGDTTTIPTNWDYVIVAGALCHMNLFKENPQGEQIAEERYKRALMQMRSALINKFDKMEDTVINYGGPPWDGTATGFY